LSPPRDSYCRKHKVVEVSGIARTLAACTAGLTLAAAAPPAAAGSIGIDRPPAAPEGGKANPSPSPPPLQAFLLASAPDSFADLQAHVGAIGVVYPTYFECALPSGALVGAPNLEIDAYAVAHGVVEEPRYTCQDGAVVHRLLTQPALRARTLAQLVALAEGPSYAGLDLDLENDGARDRGALSAFVRALAARLHARGRRLAVDVAGVTREDPRRATYLYDDRALGAAADTVFVEAWGTHWEGSAPGPLAPLRFVQAVARRLASLPHAHRFVLGVPMYGLDWPVGGGARHHATALQYAGVLALAHSVSATPVRDPASGEMTFAYTRAGVPHRVWYLDARAILDRLLIARRYGLAAGLWRLGEEDQALWSSPAGATVRRPARRAAALWRSS
jgi:spore germination protein YaaH